MACGWGSVAGRNGLHLPPRVMMMPVTPGDACRRSPPRRSALIAVVLAGFVAAPPVGAQEPGRLQVLVVSADTGEGIALARVSTSGSTAWTDGDGRAILSVPEAGSVVLEARRIGYGSRTSVVTLHDGRSPVTIVLDPVPVRLMPVEVIGESRSSWLAEFERRKGQYHGGTFLSHADIERIQPYRFSDLLRHVRGLRVECRFEGCRAVSQRLGGQAGTCPIQFFIDGVPAHGFRPDDLPVPDVEAVEVYRGPAWLPPELNRGTARCGAIVVWTRDPARR